MKLKDYLQQRGIDYKHAAKELAGFMENGKGPHPIYFNTIVNGAPPGPKLAIAIEQWSNGKVIKGELRPDLWPLVNDAA